MLSCMTAKGRAAPPSFEVELIRANDLARVREAWSDLFDRSVECNVFYGPDFLEPLATGALGDASFRALLAWRGQEGSRKLVGFMPLSMPAAPFAPVRGFKHHLLIGSTPLLDAEQPADVANALVDGLAKIRRGALLILDDVRLDWPAWRAFVDAATASGRMFDEQDIAFRAGVTPDSGEAHLKGKIAQNLRRCGAKLSKLGSWSVSMAHDPAAARAGLDALLAIEASGWKGEAGTALASDSATHAFARAAFDPANRRPMPRFSVLALEGTPIAVSMHLIGPGNAANLKCAYDEEYAASSPGVLLDAAVADDLKRKGFTPLIDSVALPGHPVERLWPERLRFGWVAIACDPAMGPREFRARLSVERLQRKMRRRAVSVYRFALSRLRKTLGRG